jgi:hypothetical protein
MTARECGLVEAATWAVNKIKSLFTTIEANAAQVGADVNVIESGTATVAAEGSAAVQAAGDVLLIIGEAGEVVAIVSAPLV